MADCHSANRRAGLQSLRDRRRQRGATLETLLQRFRFTQADLDDRRIARLLERKLTLDREIADLVNAGYREERVAQFANRIGFSDKEFAADQRIAWVVAAIFDARRYLTSLQPSRSQADPKPSNTPQE